MATQKLELIWIGKDKIEFFIAKTSFEELDITFEEKAFYDILI